MLYLTKVQLSCIWSLLTCYTERRAANQHHHLIYNQSPWRHDVFQACLATTL